MYVFAQDHGIPFEIRPSMFMAGALAYVVGASPRRKIVHSPARAWDALRRAASPRPAPRRPPASLRGAVMGIRVVK